MELLRFLWIALLVTSSSLTSINFAYAQATAVAPACAKTLTPWELAIQKHAMYSEVDPGIAQRAVNHFIRKLDADGIFFLEADRKAMEVDSARLNQLAAEFNREDYSAFATILAKFNTAFVRAEAFLKTLPNARATIIENSKSEGYLARLGNFDFETPPKTIEEQNQKLIDWMSFLYNQQLRSGHAERTAFLITQRVFVRTFRNISVEANIGLKDLGLKAVLAGLDPHSTFMNKTDLTEWDIQMSDEFGGVGVVVQEAVPGYIITVNAGGPAHKAGLQDGDIVTHVGSTLLRGLSPGDTFKLVRGEAGTDVQFKVRRGKEDLAVTVKREALSVAEQNVHSEIITSATGKKLGILQLQSFYLGSENHVKAELVKLVEQGIDGLMFELSFNGGGSVEAALNIMSFFIPGGPGILSQKNKSGSERAFESLAIPSGNVIYKGPMIIHVNEVSASGSELVAMTMRDYNRAIIVGGPRTFGKGTMQFVSRLKDETGALTGEAVKVTEKIFFGAGGNTPNIVGTKIDIQLRNLELAYGEKVLYPDTTMPHMTVPSSLGPRLIGVDRRFLDMIALLSSRHAARQPVAPTKYYPRDEQRAALDILNDYVGFSRFAF